MLYIILFLAIAAIAVITVCLCKMNSSCTEIVSQVDKNKALKQYFPEYWERYVSGESFYFRIFAEPDIVDNNTIYVRYTLLIDESTTIEKLVKP